MKRFLAPWGELSRRPPPAVPGGEDGIAVGREGWSDLRERVCSSSEG